MKAYPLIYSRTLNDDYPSGFLVRPRDLDASAAVKYVIPAMENIKYAGGIRHTVFSVGNYLIYGGVACVSDKLVELIQQSRIIDFSYREYQADKAGRPLIFFMGFAIRKSDLSSNQIPKTDLYGTYRIYLSCLKKQWLSENAVTDFSEEIELDTRPYNSESEPLSLVAGSKHILCNYSEDGFQQIIDYYFAQMAWRDGNISFLSNVLSEDVVRSPFSYISPYNCTAEDCARRIETAETHSQSKIRTDNTFDRAVAADSNRSYDERLKKKTVLSAPSSATSASGDKHSRKISLAAIVAMLAAAAIILFLIFNLMQSKGE